MYSSVNNSRVRMSRRVIWMGYVAHMGAVRDFILERRKYGNTFKKQIHVDERIILKWGLTKVIQIKIGKFV
jgi:hypothetical protein